MEEQAKPSINMRLRENDKSKRYLSNLLKLRINPKFKTVYIYSINYPTDFPTDNTKLKFDIIKSINRTIKEKFLTFITAGSNLFSPIDMANEEVKFTSNLSNTEIQYEVIIKKTDAIIDLENLSVTDKFSTQVKHFIEILIKNILHADDLMRMGKGTYFDKNSYVDLDVGKISKFFFILKSNFLNSKKRKCKKKLNNLES